MDEPQIILFIGDPYRCEVALAKREEAIFSDALERERHSLYADEIDPSVFGVELRSASLFSGRRHFIVRHAERGEAPIAAAISKGVSVGTFISLIAGELKQRSPLLRACKERGEVVTLPPPRGRGTGTAAASILAEEGLNPEKGAIDLLLSRTGGRLIAIAQEGAKLRSFSRSGELTEEAVERLVFPNAEQTVYPFFDRLGEGDLAGALAELRGLDQDPTWLLTGAIRHLTRLVMIRLLLDRKTPRKRIVELIGTPDWLASRLIGQAKRHEIARLSSLLDLAIALDIDVKGGKIPASDALLKLVLSLTPREAPLQPSPG